MKYFSLSFMHCPLFAWLILFGTACTSSPNRQRDMPAELEMLVGTYTADSSKGIYSFRFNQETGKATLLNSFEMPNPSYLTPSADGNYVYAVSEMDDSTAAVYALQLNKQTGKLTLLNRQATCGGAPCYVATNGRCVLTANYSGGSMSVLPLRPDGRLKQVDTLFQGLATGPNTQRQATPHVHCTCFSPDGQYIFATDFSSDRLLRYVIHPKDVVPHPSAEATLVETGSGPRHLTFSPNAKFAYLISELSGKITVFSYHDGCLQKIQTITADTLRAAGSADIHLSPDGNYLYASNRLQGDGIAIFTVDTVQGTLAKVGYQHTGLHPRHFNITPNGKYLLVACRDSNVIQVYQRDMQTGFLTYLPQDIALSQPVCIQFVSSQQEDSTK